MWAKVNPSSSRRLGTRGWRRPAWVAVPCLRRRGVCETAHRVRRQGMFETPTTPFLDSVRKRDYRCGGCGYGIRASRLPDSCPMCHASAASWQRVRRPARYSALFSPPPFSRDALHLLDSSDDQIAAYVVPVLGCDDSQDLERVTRSTLNPIACFLIWLARREGP